MAATNGSNPDSDLERSSRRVLTFLIVSLSVVGVVVLSCVVIVMDRTPDTLKLVYASVLPLLASWVGTILAFYFSKENFLAATQSVTEMTKAVTGVEKLKAIPVREKMRPLSQITYQQVLPADDDKVKLSDLQKTFAKVDRIPILDDKLVVRFLIYRGMIDKYLSRFTPGGATAPSGRPVAELTLKDLVNSDPDWKRTFENSFGFVAETATLAEAKAVMDVLDKIYKCNDVFVTKTGKRDEGILGWITDNKIAENARV